MAEDSRWDHGTVSETTRKLRLLPAPVRELLAGGIAGVVGKTCVAPLERCKILFQTGRLGQGSVSDTLKRITETEGISGLFRGNGAMVLRIVPYASIHFGLYEYYRRICVDAWRSGGAPKEALVPPSLDLVAGSAAGATAVIATYPLDLVRTRLAYSMEEVGGAARSTPALRAAAEAPGSTRAPASLPHSIWGMLRLALRREGVRGMYHGVGASLYGILPYAGLKFFVYQSLKQHYQRLGGTITSSERARASAEVGRQREEERLTVPEGDAEARSRMEALLEASAEDEPESMLPSQSRLPIPVMLLFGGVAGLVAQTATYPFDVVRRRMQVEALALPGGGGLADPQGVARRLSLRSTPQAMALLARTYGWRTLFSGLSINYLKVVPSTAIGFTVYDFMKSLLALPTHL